MIKLCNVSKYYYKGKPNEIIALKDINLDLPSNGIVCIIGPSGSGKTTLLNVIGGIDKAKGKVYYDNKDFSKNIDKFRINNIGYIFQNYNIFEDNTVYENMDYVANIFGLENIEEKTKLINDSLQKVGLLKYRKKRAGLLSGGEQQRLSIARVLLSSHKIVIADEPTGNLDSENTEKILDILQEIGKNSLVILVTHDKAIAYKYANQIIEMDCGEIINDINNIPIDQKDSDLNLPINISNKKNFLNSIKAKCLYFINRTNRYFLSSSKERFFRFTLIAIGICLAIVVIVFNQFQRYDRVDVNNIYDPNALVIINNDLEEKPLIYFSREQALAFMGDSSSHISGYNINGSFNQVGYFDLTFTANLGINSPNYSLVGPNVYYSINKIFDNTDYDFFCGTKATKEDEIMIDIGLAEIIVEDISKIIIGFDIPDLMELELEDNYRRYKITGITNYGFKGMYIDETIYYSIQQPGYLNRQNLPFNVYNYDYVTGDIEEIDTRRSNRVNIYVSRKVYEQHFFSSYTTFHIIGVFEDTINENALAFASEEDYLRYIYYDSRTKIFNVIDENQFIMMPSEENVNLISGRMPQAKNEIIVPQVYYDFADLYNEENAEAIAEGFEEPFVVAFEGYEIVGVYRPETYDIYEYQTIMYATKETVCEKIYSYKSITNMYAYIISDNNQETINYLASQGYTAVLHGDLMLEEYYKEKTNNQIIVLTITAIFVLTQTTLMLFMARSRVIKDMKIIGLRRVLGETNRNIYQKYFVDGFITTTFTTIIGFLLATFINNMLFDYTSNMHLQIHLLMISVVIIYIFNILIIMIPVNLLLRKAPIEIVSKHDA